jgi:DNA polymerase-3 subunit alpha
MTIGGIITSVRTIVTKSGSKMAFVGLEDKTGEGEMIVFPSVYEQVGAKLVQDAVVVARGKNSARDRDGNLGSESKLMADEITTINDSDVNDYQSTGGTIAPPKVSVKVKQEKRAEYSARRSGGRATPAVAAKPAAVSQATTPPIVQPMPENVASKLFVHVKNPDNHQALVDMKSLCNKHPGMTDVVLVLGEANKSAIKLAFKVDASETLVGQLHELLGQDCVVLK